MKDIINNNTICVNICVIYLRSRVEKCSIENLDRLQRLQHDVSEMHTLFEVAVDVDHFVCAYPWGGHQWN